MIDNKKKSSTDLNKRDTPAADNAGPVTRVLLVDDNRDNLLTLGVLLRSEGYIVDLASNGAEGLRRAEAYRPDVVVLDLVMPDQSGVDVANELRGRYGDNCPVLIAISAHETARTREEVEMAGFYRFVAKPYDPQALLHLIESLDRIP